MYFLARTRYLGVFELIIFLGELFSAIQAYNLYVDRASVYSNPRKNQQLRESYFGFSVGLYSNAYDRDETVIVGSPRANTSLKSINEPGTVYKCSLDNCEEWILDDAADEKYNDGRIFRQKSWLGASISVDNSTYPAIMVCAPRWKIKWDPDWYMNGMCYYAKTNYEQSFYDTTVEKFMPLSVRTEQTAMKINHEETNYKYGMGSFGFSLHTYEYDDEWKTVIGAPGVYNSLGSTVLWSRNKSHSEYTIADYDDNNHDYLGYSVTSGKYFGGNQIHFAAGAPRDSNVTGRVRIFNYEYDYSNFNKTTLKYKNIRILDTLKGLQKGEYFGAALTSCDIDNDGRDEIIVGAPTWTKNGDEGSVYIFTTKNTEKFELTLQINGTVIDARFGTTVVCLGDIDRDGYQDIAIGAPYENNHGAVYILNGNKNGLTGTWSQRIYGGDILHKPRGFGISISEPRDIDGNGYNDLAVGAYLSGHAVILRSLRVVAVEMKMYAEPMKIQRDTISFPIKICSSYTGTNPPNKLHTIIKLKIDEVHERAYGENLIRRDRIYIIPNQIPKGEEKCQNITIRLKKRIQNIIDPIEISASMIHDPKFESMQLPLRDFFDEYAKINENKSRAEDNVTVPFELNCGPDNICHSDIKLSIETDLMSGNRIVISDKDTMKLFINVRNYGEPAYEALVHILIPKSMGLTNIPENCHVSRGSEVPEFICHIGNPLTDEHYFTLELSINQTKNIEDHVDIITFVTTRSQNSKTYKSKIKTTIHFDTDVDISVTGNAHKTSYSAYDDDEQKLKKIEFQHIYEVRKFGITPVKLAQLNISIPTYIYGHINNSIIEIAEVTKGNISLSDSDNKENSYCRPPIGTENIHDKLKYLTKNTNPNNNTLYINCSNPLVVCVTIPCVLNTSSISLTTVQVTVTMELLLKNFGEDVMNGMSIIYFESNGHVNITSPTGITQKFNNKPDYTQVGTTFDISPPVAPPHRTPLWIIILSILVGIIFMALLTFALIKLGFFRRKKKKELKRLKSGKEYGLIEASSSRETHD